MPSVTQLPLFDNLEPLTKRCSKCNQRLPLTDEFWYKRNKDKDTYYNQCKKCMNQKREIYVKENIEKVKQTIKRWQQANRDKCNKSYREWYHRNIDTERKRNADFRKDNPQIIKKLKRKWQKENPEKSIAISHRRRAKKKGGGGSYTQEELKAQFESQGRRCFHCGKFISLNSSKTCHVDHWIPISRGGSNNIDNIRLLCPFCNLSKHDKLPSEWHSKYL